MKYEGLARTYRPQTFADVVGQEITVRTLQQALRTGRTAHAYLLTGSRGIGKTTLARLLAKAFACEQGPTPTPCDTCGSCREISEGRCLDVMEIDGASHTGVDDVRALRDSARYGPAKSSCKVFIIDEVHMLSQNAFNALLKTLEEPPPHVRFIFATTEAHKIPATVLSRCQRYDLQRHDTDIIAQRLKFVLQKESIDLPAEAMHLIAEAAEGSLRDALSLADQVISFAPDSPTAKDVATVLGIPDGQCVQQLAEAIFLGDAAVALEICANAAASGMDGQKLLRSLAWRMRHLAVAARAGSDEQLIPLPIKQRQELANQAKKLDVLDPQRLLAMAIEGMDRVGRSLDPWLTLELVVLQMVSRPQSTDTVGISHAIARLEALTRAVLSGMPQQPPKPSHNDQNPPEPLATKGTQCPPAVTTNSKPPERSQGMVSKGTQCPQGVASKGTQCLPEAPTNSKPTEKWQAFVQAVHNNNPLVASHLEHGCLLHEESFPSNPQEKNQLRVSFTSRLHHEMVRHKCDDPLVRQEVERHFGAKARLCPMLAEKEDEENHDSLAQQRQTQKQQQEQELRRQAEQNPFVQEALKLFGGEIRSVTSLPENSDAAISSQEKALR